jgi:ribonuclease HIII
MSSPACFTTTIDLSLKEKLKDDLLSQGFVLSDAPYAYFSAKKQGISCNLYLSGKLTVQGKGKEEFIAYYLEPEILNNLSYTHPEVGQDMSARIGLDEAGKGDFFGPLCIAGLYSQEGDVQALLKLGVRDSKRMTDSAVLALSKKLKAEFPYRVLRLLPETYNKLYSKFHNLNRMLAWGHSTVLEELSAKTQCKKAILDQFADEKVVLGFLKQKKLEIDLTQRHRGEEDPVVAGASILARATFLEGLEELSSRFQVELPKGASSLVIAAGKKIVAKHGPDILPSVCKMHFKTAQEVLHA